MVRMLRALVQEARRPARTLQWVRHFTSPTTDLTERPKQIFAEEQAKLKELKSKYGTVSLGNATVNMASQRQNGRNEASKRSLREGEAMPLKQHWIPRSYYSAGPKYNKRAGDGKGPPTVRQKRISTEVMEVISEALQQGPCYSPVLHRCGFQILKVKMSSDLRTAHVLWTALPGMQMTAEKAAISKVIHLRSLVFRRLNLPFSPILKFQEDKPSQEMLALDEAFAKIKEEEGEGQNFKEEEGEDQKLEEEEGERQNLEESEEVEVQNASGSELDKQKSSTVP